MSLHPCSSVRGHLEPMDEPGDQAGGCRWQSHGGGWKPVKSCQGTSTQATDSRGMMREAALIVKGQISLELPLGSGQDLLDASRTG
jgi:hypothetical protein